MKNNLFRKATALVMGSLMVFSGQALAASSNNKEFTDADVLGNSESVIAQGLSLAIAVGVAVEALGRAVTVVRTVSIQQNFPPELRNVVLARLQSAQRSLGTAQSSAQRGDNFAAARAIATAVSTLGNTVQAVARADAGSARAIAEAIASANEARAIALGQATSQPR